MHIPLLWNPLGWAVLGVAGYLVYRAGKSAGKKEVRKEAEKS
jgi:hypothetical protein